MRLLGGLALLIIVFAILVRLLPPAWALPLYLTFLVLTVAFTGWERRRIAARRRQLESELQKERMEFNRRRSKQAGNGQSN